jgi:transposase
MPTGRPTDYLPEFCERVIEYGKAGKSVAWWAAELGVNKDTLYEWVKVHPEFSDAFNRGRLESQRWWEDLGQEYALSRKDGPTLNAGVYNRSMAARFPDDWREKSETTHLGPNGGPVQIVASQHDENL